MPYQIIRLNDRVKIKATGQVGRVVAEGSPLNPHAHFFVKVDGCKPIWYARNEVELVQ